MSDATPNTKARRWRGIAAERLFRGRWTIAAAVAGIAGVALSGGNAYATLAAAALVLAVAALAPRRPSATGTYAAAEGSGAGIREVSALDLAAAVPDPLIIFDRRGAALYANEAAAASFGPINRGLSLQMKFRAPEMRSLIDSAIGDDGASAIAADYAERVPIERYFRVSAMPVGEGTGLFALVFKDQSESRRIDTMRADFIANASHELRTPLASIAGFIETLRGPAKNDERARENFLGIMHDQTGRMSRLIDDLLSLSRLEMKPLIAPGARVDLIATVESVIGSLAPLARESGVEILRDFPGSEIAVPGSRDELFQVFENLLENACKYGRSGGKVVVAIRDDSQAGEATVSFRDFGPGIAEEHLPRVTERFYRVDGEASRAQKGTGLGLSIVKHILTRHNARLTIRSEPGDGAEFTVHLPLAQAGRRDA
jgi:two-component system phosphate regulon sensor histidine kinase PhoR